MSEEMGTGYKRTDVGVIPEDWETRPCSELSERIMVGIVIRPTQYYVRQGVPAFRSANIREDGISDADMVFISDASNALLAKSQTQVGDVLTVRTGYPGTSAVVRPVHAGCNCIDILITRSSKKINSEYLTVWVNSSFGKEQVLRNQGGLAQKHFNVGDMRNLVVALPSLPEQRAIAEALSDVDALLGALDRLIAKKRDLKQAAMQQLLTGQTRLPSFHGEWEVKRVGDMSPFQRGFDLPTPQLRRGPYPVVYSNGILNYHDAFQVKGPGVVTGRSGTIGKVTFVENDFWPHNTSLWVTRFNGNDIRFIFYLFTKLGLQRFATGSGVPTLNRNDVHAFEVLIPPTAKEQTAIATILSDMDTELAALAARREKTQALKQGMMQELLTGKTRLLAPGACHA